MLKTAVEYDGASAVRYPRGSVSDTQEEGELKSIPVGKSEVLKEGNDVLIIAIGNMVEPAVEAAGLLADGNISACVINARFVKPLDTDTILSRAKDIKHVITVEENVIAGGFGSAVLEELTKAGIDGIKCKMIGIPDAFIEQGPQNVLRKQLGLDAEGIAKEALALAGNKSGSKSSV
jgi:1-deoxy-D-xylulose-5-phosphate synthase